jgi:hypothetical protein
MKLLPWPQWLDEHIPYYEAERLRPLHQDNPPAVVLVVEPRDRIPERGTISVVHKTRGLLNWEEYITDTKLLEHGALPLFLESDSRQEWYWAFWDANEALIAVMKL